MIYSALFFKPGVRPGSCSCESPSAGVWSGAVVNGLCGVYFFKSLRKFFSSLSEAGAPIPGMRNSSLHNQKWDILEWSLWWCREWNKILLPAGTSMRVVGKNKVSIKELERKWIPRMIFCLQTHLITRVFRVLNIFLSTRQPILSPFVIWTLLCCSLQTFVPHTQGCTFLISRFLTLLQF